MLAGGASGEPEPASDSPALASRARLVLSALRRRKWIALLCFALVMVATLVILRWLPKTYRVETRILAQRSEALPSAVRQSQPAREEAPTKSAWETIHRHDNLVALVKQLGLFKEHAPEPRVPSIREQLGLPPLGLRDPEPTETERLSVLVTILDRSIVVTTTESTVTVTVDWNDPQMAYRICEAIVQNFMESRQLQEITAMDESISLLTGRAEGLRQQLRGVQETVEKERQAIAAGEMVAITHRAPAGATPGAVPGKGRNPEDLVQLRSMLEAKRRAIRDVEDFRRRRLADLQAQLDEKRGIYSDAFPSVVSLKQDIEALSKESPQVTALRQEEGQLAEEISLREPAPVGQPPEPGRGQAAKPLVLSPRALAIETTEQGERIKDARFRYERMVERINQAQLELDYARAAFKYRYAIVAPAEVPTRPIRPKPYLVIGAGLFFATLFAMLVAVLIDMRKGQIHDAWRLQELLDVPLLVEMRRL